MVCTEGDQGAHLESERRRMLGDEEVEKICKEGHEAIQEH